MESKWKKGNYINSLIIKSFKNLICWFCNNTGNEEFVEETLDALLGGFGNVYFFAHLVADKAVHDFLHLGILTGTVLFCCNRDCVKSTVK